ncbi:MAG: ribokinase [Solobacterium sp.]|nr:ribokinase [Solobacterium sp.]
MKILNFGSLNLDYTYGVNRFVKPGETMSAKTHSVNTGGKGLNQSVALARAGGEVYHAGCYGKGGESLAAFLNDSGVHTQFLRRVDEYQGNAFIQVNEEGENCIILYGGSNQCITKKQIGETLSHFEEGDWLVLQNEINLNEEIVEAAYEKGLKIVLNPSPYDEKIAKIDFGKLHWLFVNEIEAEQIYGFTNITATWEKLHEEYPQLSLLVTLGEEGSIAFTKEETVTENAFCLTVEDTTGAGDTYSGYMIAALSEGRCLKECMERASIAAGISVSRKGAAASVPSAAEVTQYFLKK